MQIKVRNEMIDVIGNDFCQKVGIRRSYTRKTDVDLSKISIENLKQLMAMIEPRTKKGPLKIGNASKNYKAIKMWVESMESSDVSSEIVRNVKHLQGLLINYLAKVPGHRVFIPDSSYTECNLCYYVSRVTYTPPRRDRWGYYPPYVTLDMNYTTFEGEERYSMDFHDDECKGTTVEKVLLKKNIFVENLELRKTYLEEKKRFEADIKNIGKQYLADGVATDDCDGNTEKKSGWWSRTENISLEKDDEKSKVVMDVFYETDADKESKYHPYIESEYWKEYEPKDDLQEVESEEDDDSDEEETENEDGTEQAKLIELPVHPYVVVFDLRKHRRIKVHVNQLEDYKYDTKLGEKLILPEQNHALVETLMESNIRYKDVIKGKGGGAVILSAGPPGTGKTLTAEVFSEVAKKPLYSVQCSQLGTSQDELEESLLKIFARSQRWNAVLLLDEADVYIRQRGDDIQQNAIVGVFLRTLEYYQGVLFMTTNRPETVDDAVASRCVARITYGVPSIEDQEKIWRVLSQSTGVKIEEKELKKILAEHMNLTGRDIKNLVKLAIMVSGSKKEPITSKTIEFVKQFKPTLDEVKKGK